MKSNIIGLTSQQVLQARIDYGSNALKRKKRKSFVIKLIENLSDPIIRILLIATFLRIILSFGNCNWFEIGGILIAVLVSATVTALSEWGSEKAFEKMEGEEKKQKVCVLRDNTL